MVYIFPYLLFEFFVFVVVFLVFLVAVMFLVVVFFVDASLVCYLVSVLLLCVVCLVVDLWADHQSEYIGIYQFDRYVLVCVG